MYHLVSPIIYELKYMFVGVFFISLNQIGALVNVFQLYMVWQLQILHSCLIGQRQIVLLVSINHGLFCLMKTGIALEYDHEAS